MPELKELLERCARLAQNPAAALKKAVEEGRKVIGVMPYFCPEELVYAAGMLPFGLWGAEMQANLSKRYFPAFYCSLAQTTLEMGLRGDLDALSGIMLPISCDTLKGMAANWKYGVGDKVPVVNVCFGLNNRLDATVDYNAAQLRKILRQLEEIAGRAVSPREIAAAVSVYNENRAACLRFAELAGKHPELVSPAARSAVFKAGYFMDRADHSELLGQICQALSAAPEQPWSGPRIVTTGILADMPELLKILEQNRIAVAADQVAHESVANRTPTPVTEDPILGMARRLSSLRGCSVLYDPDKERGRELVRLARETGADGVLWVMAKFCDPEEYDFVPVRRMLDEAGVPVLCVEVDQQMVNYEQARSAVETFADILK